MITHLIAFLSWYFLAFKRSANAYAVKTTMRIVQLCLESFLGSIFEGVRRPPSLSWTPLGRHVASLGCFVLVTFGHGWSRFIPSVLVTVGHVLVTF